MKLIKRTYEVGGENVSLSPATISHGEIDMIGIELNIGGFVDATGGSDGESAFFSMESPLFSQLKNSGNLFLNARAF